MLKTPFYSHNLIHKAGDVGGKDSVHATLFDPRPCELVTQGEHAKLTQFEEPVLDEETDKLLIGSSSATANMIIDDTTTPQETTTSPSKQNWTERVFGRKEIGPVSIPIPTQCSIGDDDDVTFPCSTDPVDFNLETPNEGDQLPLIRGPNSQGIIHRLLRRLRVVKVKGPIFLNPSEDDETTEEGKEAEDSRTSGNGTGKGSRETSEVSKSQCSIGILLASISCIFFATSSLIVKVSSLHPMELLCVRGFVQAILILPVVLSSGSSLLGSSGTRGLLLARATLGSVSLIMAFNSIHLIPLADASTVIFTSPVFVSLFACICLGELCTAFDVSMIILTVLGVVLVSKPSFGILDSGPRGASSWTNVLGIFCGVCAAMLTALAFIVLRQLKHVHYSVTVFWFSSVLTVFGAVLTVALDGFTLPSTWLTALQCFGIGVCGFLGQVLLTKALQLENAGPVAVARTLDIVLSFLYQIIFLHDTPDLMSYLGSTLVVGCVILTGLRRWYKETKGQRVPEVCSSEGDRRRPRGVS